MMICLFFVVVIISVFHKTMTQDWKVSFSLCKKSLTQDKEGLREFSDWNPIQVFYFLLGLWVLNKSTSLTTWPSAWREWPEWGMMTRQSLWCLTDGNGSCSILRRWSRYFYLQSLPYFSFMSASCPNGY